LLLKNFEGFSKSTPKHKTNRVKLRHKSFTHVFAHEVLFGGNQKHQM